MPSGRTIGMATPVDVSLWVNAYRSTPGAGFGSGRVPGSDSMTSGSSSHGAAVAHAANFDENSPKLRCWLRRSISPKHAASQNTVVPPLPSTTSYPAGSWKSSARPDRTRPTTDRTAGWRWLVPRYDVPVAASAATASGRTFDGPQPNRPSDGSKPAGKVYTVRGAWAIGA